MEDAGRSNSEDIQRKILGPFFTTKAPEEGTCLCLAMVQAISKVMMGSSSALLNQGRHQLQSPASVSTSVMGGGSACPDPRDLVWSDYASVACPCCRGMEQTPFGRRFDTVREKYVHAVSLLGKLPVECAFSR